MCDLAQWSRRVKHDGAETIALVVGIKQPKPLLSLDHCSGRSLGDSASAHIPSNHQALKPLLFGARLSVSDGERQSGTSRL
jgi:hypothetical protein